MAGNVLRRIERPESIDGAHGVRDAELQAAQAVLAEPDAWSRDNQRAQQAFATSVQYFGCLVHVAREAVESRDDQQAARRLCFLQRFRKPGRSSRASAPPASLHILVPGLDS